MLFPNLSKEDIVVSPCKTTSSQTTFLLHKNARVDMKILDEIIGPENWQKDFFLCRDTLMCKVGIKLNGEWIWKSDAGDVPDNAFDPKKTEATDAFKRACFNWGIGRELYTAPKIIIDNEKLQISTMRGEPYIISRLFVSEIKIENDKIVSIEISQEHNGIVNVVYRWDDKGDTSSSSSSSSLPVTKNKTPVSKSTDSVSTTSKKTGFVPPTTSGNTVKTETEKNTSISTTPSNTDSKTIKEMSLDDAFAFVYPFGQKKGTTLKQLTIEDPDTIRWVANKYSGKNEELKLAAQIILESLT